MKKLIFTVVFVGVLLQGLILASAAPTEAYKWSNLPIGGGGFVTGVVVHPLEPDLVYIRTDVGGAYRWNAANQTWIPLNDSFTEYGYYGVDGIAVDPQDPDVVYMATGKYAYSAGGLMKSTDRGYTWTKTSLTEKFRGNEGGRELGECVAVDPVNSNIVYCGGRAVLNTSGVWTQGGGVYKSSDGGGSWDQLAGVPAKSTVRSVVFDQSSAVGGMCQTIYVGVSGDGEEASGVYRTQDGGQTWAIVPNTPAMVYRMDVGASGALYVASGTGLHKFYNEAWQNISPQGMEARPYYGIDVHPQDENKLICLLNNIDGTNMNVPIYYSEDGGATWTNKLGTVDFSPEPLWYNKRGNFSSNSHDIKFNPHTTDGKVGAIFTDFFGVYATDDITATPKQKWVSLYKGLEETCSFDILSPPIGKYRLLTGQADVDGHPYRSLTEYPDRYISVKDGVRGSGGIWMANTMQLEYCEEDPNIMVRVGTDWTSNVGRLEVSTDGGTTWVNRPPPKISGESSPFVILRVAMTAEKHPDTGYPVIVAGQMYKTLRISKDLGLTWEKPTIEGLGTNEQNFYGSSYWGSRFYNIAADRVEGSRIYFCATWNTNGRQIYVSDDWGKTFKRASYIIGGVANSAYLLKTAPGMADNVWLSIPDGGGLYRSANNGATGFTKLTNVQEVRSFGFGKAAPGVNNPTVYMFGKVDNVQGLYRSIDMGNSWKRINDDRTTMGNLGGLPSFVEGDLRQFGIVYVGSDGRGIFCGMPATDVEVPIPYIPDSFVPTKLPLTVAASAKNKPARIADGLKYIKEDFQSYEKDSVNSPNGLNGWTVSYANLIDGSGTFPNDGTSLKIVADPPNDASGQAHYDGDVNNKAAAFHIEKSGTTGIVQADLRFDNIGGEQTNGVVTAQFRWRHDQVSDYSEIKWMDDSKEIVSFRLSPGQNGGMRVYLPATLGGLSEKTVLLEGPLKNWSTIKTRVDFQTKTVTVFLNDTEVISGYLKNQQAAAFSHFSVINHNRTGAENFVDDIYVVDGENLALASQPLTYSVIPDSVLCHYNEDDSATLTASINKGVGDAFITMAAYNSDNMLLALTDPILVDGDTYPQDCVYIDQTMALPESVTKVRVYVWDSAATLTPLCDAVDGVIVRQPLRCFSENFQGDTYPLDQSINDVNGWVMAGTGNGYVVVDPTIPVEPGATPPPDANKVLHMRPVSYYGLSKSFAPGTNVGRPGPIDITFRMMLTTAGSESRGMGVYLYGPGSTSPFALFGYGPMNTGTSQNGVSVSSAQQCFYMPIGTAILSDGNAVTANTYVLQRSPAADKKTWHYVRIQVDMETRKIDCYVATKPITNEMMETKTDLAGYALDIPFRDGTDSVANLDRIRLYYNGPSSRGVTYFDDITVSIPKIVQ